MNKLYTIIILVVLAIKPLNAQVNYISLYDKIYNTATFKDDSRILNTSLPVGSLSGNVNVSSIGAATYNIPVDIPAGVAGIHLPFPYRTTATEAMARWALAGVLQGRDRPLPAPAKVSP